MFKSSYDKRTYGLVKGRHEMPVKDYIFGEIKDPTNVRRIEEEAEKWASSLDLGRPAQVTIYVTGLTVCLIASLNAIKKLDRGVLVELKHFDSVNKEYFSQFIKF